MSVGKKVRAFDFSRDGHANRRYHDAEPHVLVTGFDLDTASFEYHAAGDAFIRSLRFVELEIGDPLIDGMEPHQAFRIGIWTAQAMEAAYAE